MQGNCWLQMCIYNFFKKRRQWGVLQNIEFQTLLIQEVIGIFTYFPGSIHFTRSGYTPAHPIPPLAVR